MAGLMAGILIVAITSFYIKPRIDNRTWVLSYAVCLDPQPRLIAHKKGSSLANGGDPYFRYSKPIELICKAKNGKLLLTDQTNGKTYEGTYQVHYWICVGSFKLFKKQAYTVCIDGVEGLANFSSRRILSMTVGNYNLNFEVA